MTICRTELWFLFRKFMYVFLFETLRKIAHFKIDYFLLNAETTFFPENLVKFGFHLCKKIGIYCDV